MSHYNYHWPIFQCVPQERGEISSSSVHSPLLICPFFSSGIASGRIPSQIERTLTSVKRIRYVFQC